MADRKVNEVADTVDKCLSLLKKMDDFLSKKFGEEYDGPPPQTYFIAMGPNQYE